MTKIDLLEKVGSLGLPFFDPNQSPPKPAGNYSALKVVNDLAFISGQMPTNGQKERWIQAEYFRDLPAPADQGYEEAKMAMLNALLQLAHAPTLSHVEDIVTIDAYFSIGIG